MCKIVSLLQLLRFDVHDDMVEGFGIKTNSFNITCHKQLLNLGRDLGAPRSLNLSSQHVATRF